MYVRWGYDRRDAQKWVNMAKIDIKLSGFGWSKIEVGNDDYDHKIAVHNGHIIEFEHNHVIVVPAIPVVDMVEKLGMENRWPCVIQGVFDTRSEWFRMELKWR